MSPIKQVVPFVLMPQEMIFYGVYLVFPFLFWVNVGRPEPIVSHNGREAWRIPPEPTKPDTSIIFKNPARSCHRAEKIFSPAQMYFVLYYRNGWRINLWWMRVYRMCYQANVLISWSFWLHEFYGSDVPFPMISLAHHLHKCLSISENEMPLPSTLSPSPNLHFNLFIPRSFTSLWPNILNYWW